MTPWFRLYTEARSDRKLAKLSGEQFRVWFNLLCYAAEQPTRGTILVEDIDLLALEVADDDPELLETTISLLIKLRIVTRCHAASRPENEEECDSETEIHFLNFMARQYDKPSDAPEAVRERKQRQRERSKPAESASLSQNEESHAASRGVTPLSRERTHIAEHKQSIAENNRTEHKQSRAEQSARDSSSADETLTSLPALPAAVCDSAMDANANAHSARVTYGEALTILRQRNVPREWIEEAKTAIEQRGKPVTNWLKLLELKISDLHPSSPAVPPKPPPKELTPEEKADKERRERERIEEGQRAAELGRRKEAERHAARANGAGDTGIAGSGSTPGAIPPGG